eukprot:195911-Prymnesium_polylepis.1
MLLTLQHSIASFFWYFWNLTPFERGSPTTGLLLHHAMWLSAFGEADRPAALLCIPPQVRYWQLLRESHALASRAHAQESLLWSSHTCAPQQIGAFVDWEAQSARSANEYAEHGWWGMFAGKGKHMMECLTQLLHEAHGHGRRSTQEEVHDEL